MSTNLQFIKEFEITGTLVQNFDCDNIFSSDYDAYFFTYELKESSSGNDQWVRMRLIDSSGSVISDSEYDYAQLVLPSNATYYQTVGVAQDNWTYAGVGYSDDTGNAGSIYIYSPNDSGSYTYLTTQASSTVGNTLYGTKGIGVHKAAETIRGLRFYTTTYWNSGSVSVYGVK